jgi:hypothetical protein
MTEEQTTYELFVLGVWQHPGLRFERLMNDYDGSSRKPSWMKRLITEYKKTYTAEELQVYEHTVIDHHVHRIAKTMAIEMVATGKSSVNTLTEMLMLPDNKIDDTIRMTNKMALEIDTRVRDASTTSAAHTFTGKL